MCVPVVRERERERMLDYVHVYEPRDRVVGRYSRLPLLTLRPHEWKVDAMIRLADDDGDFENNVLPKYIKTNWGDSSDSDSDDDRDEDAARLSLSVLPSPAPPGCPPPLGENKRRNDE